jgi:undecaprenyl diphosphate synthase
MAGADGNNPMAEPQAINRDGARPRHVAIIMDGNGRWAAQRSLPRSAGHKKGVDSVRRAVRGASDLGLEYLTLFSFSSENWRRPKEEVDTLMYLFKRFIRQDLSELHKADVKVLDPEIFGLIEHAEELTGQNRGLHLQVAFNYGSREEIASAARALAEQAACGRLDPDQITADTLSAELYTAGVPDPDLVIRTSGERRVSNFLLWQCAYAEFVFADKLWPDFTGEDLKAAIAEFGRRDRRFGGVRALGV